MHKYYLAIWGKIVGGMMILAPALFDVAMYGIRGYEEMAIKWVGILCMFIGVGIWTLGWVCNRELYK